MSRLQDVEGTTTTLSDIAIGWAPALPNVPLVRLSQSDLEWLEGRCPDVEDLLPLSPVQQALLPRAAAEAQAPDVHTVQLVLSLEGAVDPKALQASAQIVAQRHANLRAGFLTDGLERAVQVIVPCVAIPWRSSDLALLDGTTRDKKLTAMLAEDRAERFDLTKPPLLRFTLIRLAADQYRLVLTYHQIVLDGGSLAILVRELFSLCAHNGTLAALPRPTPYRDYLGWLAAQDSASSLAAWRDVLAGLEEFHPHGAARNTANRVSGADHGRD